MEDEPGMETGREHLTGIEGYTVMRGGRKLRCGFTTGTCAAAAAQGAVRILLGETGLGQVHIITPKGIELDLLLENVSLIREGAYLKASCGVRKDAGDDPDVTDGILVMVSAECSQQPGIRIDGGKGVGTAVLPGLAVPEGEAAINPVPREMIRREARKAAGMHGYSGGLIITVSVPEGERLAEKTFNPRIGIRGGISILGTTGIVEPMSERAVIESIRVEMRQRLALGEKVLLITPGNYGKDFAENCLDLPAGKSMKCGNYIGETIDMAVELGAGGILFVSHIGKFVKVAGGIMDTHSRSADARMEILCAAAIRAGAGTDLAGNILACGTTEEALRIIEEGGFLEKTVQKLTDRIQYYLDCRSRGSLICGAVIFSQKMGYLGRTTDADKLIGTIRGSGR